MKSISLVLFLFIFSCITYAHGESANPYLGNYQISMYFKTVEDRSFENSRNNRTWMISEEFSKDKKICWENGRSRECEFLGKEVVANATSFTCLDLDRNINLSFADSIPVVIATCCKSNYWQSHSTMSVEYGSQQWMTIKMIDTVTFYFYINRGFAGVGYERHIDEGFVLKKVK